MFSIMHRGMYSMSGIRRDVSSLKAFLNEAFRLRKLLAHKDAELAALRGEWLKHSASAKRRSLAAIRTFPSCATIGSRPTNRSGSAGKPWLRRTPNLPSFEIIVLTLTRRSGSPRRRLAQRDARLVGRPLDKVLAEKDAELAQSREHWNEALRLCQEALAQSDAEFAELRVEPVLLGMGPH